jgi:uncharacterized protein YjbI with pentapeptide repeats
MANDEHAALLKQGVAGWNAWREKNRDIQPDLGKANLIGLHLDDANLNRANLSWANLTGANLAGADLAGADLSDANLSRANLIGANLDAANLIKANLSEAGLSDANLSEAALIGADLSEVGLSDANLSGARLVHANLSWANLSGANLAEANLSWAKLIGANLIGADLDGANLLWADLHGANLSGANLNGAQLVDTDLTDANVTGCRIFGISAWRLKVERTKQQNLVITSFGEPEITVDNIEVAQFLYLLINNQKIRDVIDTITSKAVLILGRFTADRKAVLDALREELRKRDYLPILFDFEKPRSRDTDETITLLARMARFVIADVSDAKAVLQELRGIVPDLPSVPVQPIIVAAQDDPGMFDHYRHMPWFLPVHRYADQEQLLADLGDKVIRPAELKVLELRG